MPGLVVVLGGKDLVERLLTKRKMTGIVSEKELEKSKINRVVVVEISKNVRAKLKEPAIHFFPDGSDGGIIRNLKDGGSCSCDRTEGNG
jgi:hypothetical protein